MVQTAACCWKPIISEIVGYWPEVNFDTGHQFYDPYLVMLVSSSTLWPERHKGKYPTREKYA